MELCYKLSDLSIRFSCNFNVLENGIIPKQLGLKDILLHFINHRKTSIKRKSEFNINKIELRLEILEGYLITYKYLETIIKIIRTKEDPKKEIIKKYKLTINQADAILSMRLGSLKKLDEMNTKKEIKKLKEEKNYLNKLIKDNKTLNSYLIDEIKKINKDIDQNIAKRKTTISFETIDHQNLNFDEFQEVEKITVLITKDKSLKKIKEHIDLAQLKNNDKSIQSAIHLMSNQKLLIFVSSGRVFTLDPNLLPSGKSNPKSFVYFIEVGTEEKMVNILLPEENKKCVLASSKGKGFITDTFSLISNQKKGKKVLNLKTNDSLIKVLDCDKSHLATVNKSKKILIFPLESLPVLQKGVGVQLMRIKESDALSDIQLIDLSNGLTWQIGSKMRTLENIDFWIGKRAQSGKKVPKYFNKNLKFYE